MIDGEIRCINEGDFVKLKSEKVLTIQYGERYNMPNIPLGCNEEMLVNFGNVVQISWVEEDRFRIKNDHWGYDFDLIESYVKD